MPHDSVVAVGTGFYDLARDQVRVDYGERVPRREEGGDGGFSGCDGAC